MAQIDIKNCTIKFVDGTTPTANELIVKVGEGNLTWTEKRNILFIKDRGHLDLVREGAQVPVDVSLSFVWQFLTTMSGDTVPTPEEVLKQTGLASSWVTTDSDTCRPYAIDIVLLDVLNCGGTEDEKITLADFRYESLDHDLKAGTVSVTGKCNITSATAVRF